MAPRPAHYEHRVEPETPHKIDPVRDWMSNNPNRCGDCGMAIRRVTPDRGEAQGEVEGEPND